MFPNAGRLLYIIHSIEFQKRGLPHAHILLKFKQDCVHPCDIDAIVNAEMPSDPDDAQLVHTLMMHSHPPLSKQPSKYCQRLDPNSQQYCRFGYLISNLLPQLMLKGVYTIRDEQPVTRWWSQIVCLYSVNSNVI